MNTQTNPQAEPVIPPDIKPEEKLNIMAEDAAAQAGQNQFMSPGRKRGRPRKVPGDGSGEAKKMGPKPQPGSVGPVPQVDPIAELMPLTMGLASFYSNMLVQIAEDERAKLSKEKSDLIAHCSAVCLNQYWPGALGKHASAIVLAVTVGETSFVAYRLRKENLERLREEARRRGPVTDTHTNGTSASRKAQTPHGASPFGEADQGFSKTQTLSPV